jgi:hypothetical protein
MLYIVIMQSLLPGISVYGHKSEVSARSDFAGTSGLWRKFIIAVLRHQ